MRYLKTLLLVLFILISSSLLISLLIKNNVPGIENPPVDSTPEVLEILLSKEKIIFW